MRSLNVVRLGLTEYRSCWDLQQRLLHLRMSEHIGDTLLLTEHEHVYTIGKGGGADHLLASQDELVRRGIGLAQTDRGGDITYHGPGQLVGYPIIDLNGFTRDLHRYLRDLEEVILRTLAGKGIAGTRDSRYTGVWVGRDKICAIGVKTVRWVTMHGFALNVNTDLSYFDGIVPCGIAGRGVTSLLGVTGRMHSMNDIIDAVVEQFCAVFHRQARSVLPEDLFPPEPRNVIPPMDASLIDQRTDQWP